MGSYYTDSNDVRVLRERIEELARIRQGFAAHLGSSLYEVTKDNPEFRWGRESLYDGISACDSERERLMKRIQEMSGEPAPEPAPVDVFEPEPEPEPEPVAAPEPEPVAAPESEPTPMDAFTPVPAPDFAPAPEPIAAPEPAVFPEPASSISPEPPNAPDSQPAFEPEQAPGPEAGITSKLDLDKTVVNPANRGATDGGAKCPSCGSPVRPGDMFCMTCGTNLSVVQQKPSNVCPHCGSPTEPGFKFCMTCGKSLT